MDIAFNQHSPHARRSNRSTINLYHLSLAPLTAKLPLNDLPTLPSPTDPHLHTPFTSYLEGKSGPATPRLLTRNSSHTSLDASFKKKSKSSTHLLAINAQKASVTSKSKSGPSTPRRRHRDDLSITLADGGNSDWLERAGALITTQTQESRGQSWLTSRASSTSLTGLHTREAEEEQEFERALAQEREREMNRGHSRRNSAATIKSIGGDGHVADDEFSPITTRMSFGSRFGSRQNSRMGSRVGSRRASKVGLAVTPMARECLRDGAGYFDVQRDELFNEQAVAEADFVDPEEEHTMYALADEEGNEGDEMLVRRLAKRGNFGVQMFVEKLLGIHLFALEEEEGEIDDEEEREAFEDEKLQATRDDAQKRYLDITGAELESVPAPAEGAEVGSWADAAWLLSVASKVLL